MKLIRKFHLLLLCCAFVQSIAAADLLVGGITNVDPQFTPLNLTIKGRAVTFEIQPNTSYIIEVSEDLLKWSEYGRVEVGDQRGGGTFTITDDSKDLPSKKFYRVKWWNNLEEKI